MPAIFRHKGSASINDYILDSDPVPLATAKNLDNTMLVTQFDFIISNLYAKPLSGESLKVYDNDSTTLPFFSGQILKVGTNYADETYTVTAVSDFYKLQQKKLTYDNLHTQLLQTGTLNNYIASDNFGLPNASVLWIIQSMFKVAGLELVVNSDLTNKVLQTITYLGNTYDMRVGNLVFDENVLYAINQNYAANHTTLEADYDRIALQITFFDFISEFCSHVGAHLYPFLGGNPTYYQLDLIGTQIPFITDDYTYDKIEDDHIGSNNGYVHNLLFAGDRSKYNGTSLQALTEHQFLSGEGRENIDVYPNWIYQWRKLFAMGGNSGDVLGHAYPSLCWNADDFLQNKIKATVNDFLKTTFVANNFLPKNTKFVRLNVKNEEAEIEWSTEK